MGVLLFLFFSFLNKSHFNSKCHRNESHKHTYSCLFYYNHYSQPQLIFILIFAQQFISYNRVTETFALEASCCKFAFVVALSR